MNPHPGVLTPFSSRVTIIAVPLFVMISGALLLPKTETYSVFFKKRVTRVLFPWIFWSIIYTAYHIGVDHHHISSIGEFIRFFRIVFLTQLWFLPMIFGLYILMPFYRVFIEKAKKLDIIYFLCIWFLFISILPQFSFLGLLIGLPSQDNLVYQTVQYSGYLFLGYFISKYSTVRNAYLVVIFLLAVLLPAIFDLSPIFSKSIGISDQIYLSPFTIIASASFFLLAKQFIEKKENRMSRRSKALIISLSDASFGIYLIHLLILWTVFPMLNTLQFSLSTIHTVLVGPVMGALLLIVSYGFVLILEKSRLFKKTVGM